MRENLPYLQETIDKFNVYLDRTIVIKVGYLVLVFVLKWLKLYETPDIIFIAISLMALLSLIPGICLEKFSIKTETFNNLLFIFILLDLALLSVIIYYLSGIEYMYYTFYIILSFIVFPRYQAIAITAWTILLFLGLVALRYFQIVPIYPYTIPKEQQDFFHLPFVLTTVTTLVLTFSFLAYFSHGFYKMMTKRMNLSRGYHQTLEDEKKSLEIRVEARKKELEDERRTLAQRIRNRKKELEGERKELEERMKELERFQKATSGRETKTEELEKELRILKEKNKKREKE